MLLSLWLPRAVTHVAAEAQDARVVVVSAAAEGTLLAAESQGAYENCSPVGHGCAPSHRIYGCSAGREFCARAQLRLPRTSSSSRRSPLSPVNSTASPASNRDWHPFGGGGLRFILLPLTY